jgi:predicted acylesterase/phospholipase RssA
MARQHSRQGAVELDGLPALVAARHPLAMVYGGGGVFGIAYTTGVATGLAAAGIPVHTTPSLGTSAGSWTASGLALGLTYDDFEAVSSPRVPTRRPGVLADLGRELFGERSHPLVSVSAVCVRTRRRHILDGGRYPLADLVAASSAVPGLLPPHRIEGRLYVDGGMWSATSVDAAAEADQVIVVAPMAGLVLGPVGQTAGLLLQRELRRWRDRHPESTITLVRPDRAMARVAGLHPLALFDDERAHEVYPLALEQGLRVGRALLTGASPVEDVDDGEEPDASTAS